MKGVTVQATSRRVLPKGTAVRKNVSSDAVSVERRQVEGLNVISLRVAVSSTSVDRDGDAFSDAGLADLKAQFDSGTVPYYLDHGRAPGDVMPSYHTLDMLGRWTGADIEDVDGTPTLFATAELDAGDWRAQELSRKFEAGLPIGHSVAFMVTEGEARVNDEGQTVGQVFHATDLFETSGVGIPSNPDAVRENVPVIAKALGLSEAEVTKRIKAQEKKHMELTEAEVKQLEAQRAKDLDGVPVPVEAPAPESAEPGGATMSMEDVKALVKDTASKAAKEAAEAVLEAIKANGDDEDNEEEKEDGDEDEDDEKAAPAKRGPRGLRTQTKTQDAPTTEPENAAVKTLYG